MKRVLRVNQRRAHRCNRGQNPQYVTVRERTGRRGWRKKRKSEELPELVCRQSRGQRLAEVYGKAG